MRWFSKCIQHNLYWQTQLLNRPHMNISIKDTYTDPIVPMHLHSFSSKKRMESYPCSRQCFCWLSLYYWIAKRDLSHTHIIVFLKPAAKLRTLDQVDSLMSSEFHTDNPELLELIKKLMVHGLCGNQNLMHCMVGRKCIRKFPKPFMENTTIIDDSYAWSNHCSWIKTCWQQMGGLS